MLVVKVELHSAITGKVTEIARQVIYNTGSGSPQLGDYATFTVRGRDAETLEKGMRSHLRGDGAKSITRAGTVENYPRQRLHVWNLVQMALTDMGYGDTKDAPEGWD